MDKGYKDVLEVPKWKFTERVEYDGVQYIHEAGQQEQKQGDMGQLLKVIYTQAC